MDLKFSVTTVSRPKGATQLTQINADAMPNHLPTFERIQRNKRAGIRGGRVTLLYMSANPSLDAFKNARPVSALSNLGHIRELITGNLSNEKSILGLLMCLSIAPEKVLFEPSLFGGVEREERKLGGPVRVVFTLIVQNSAHKLSEQKLTGVGRMCSRVKERFRDICLRHSIEEQFESGRGLQDRLHRVEIGERDTEVFIGGAADENGNDIVGKVRNERGVRDVFQGSL